MMHRDRIWCVAPVASAEELAEKLAQSTWCLCTGFELGDYVWLNDATCEDGAQEYAVVRKPTEADPNYRQVESISASWCSQEELLRYIQVVYYGIAATDDAAAAVVAAKSVASLMVALGVNDQQMEIIVRPTIELPEQHGGCPRCA